MAELSLLPTIYNSGHSKDLKVGLSPSSKVIFICLKMMKNTFYFICKAIFALFSFFSIRNFCPNVFGHTGKRLGFSSKSMTS